MVVQTDTFIVWQTSKVLGVKKFVVRLQTPSMNIALKCLVHLGDFAEIFTSGEQLRFFNYVIMILQVVQTTLYSNNDPEPFDHLDRVLTIALDSDIRFTPCIATITVEAVTDPPVIRLPSGYGTSTLINFNFASPEHAVLS